MLGKLFKHEFTAMSRYFLPLFIFAVILTPVFSLLFRLGLNDDKGALPITAIMSAFGITGFVFSMIILFTASSIFIVIRFYRTMATSEAYLTFTLPAKPSHILLSKLLVASIWQIITFVTGIAAILAMLIIAGIFTPGQMMHGFQEFVKYFFVDSDASVPLSFSLYALAGIIGVPVSILIFYCSIMLGQLFNEHRVIASFGIYMGITTVIQIASLVLTIPITMIEPDSSASEIETFMGMNITIGLATLLNVIIGIACYLLTTFIIKKKLNVR